MVWLDRDRRTDQHSQTKIYIIHYIKVYLVSSVSPRAPVFQWPAQAPLLQRLQSRQQRRLTDNTVERLRELGIYREQEEEEEEVMENLEGGILLSGIAYSFYNFDPSDHL